MPYWTKKGVYPRSQERTSTRQTTALSAAGGSRATPSISISNEYHSSSRGIFYSPFNLQNMTADSSLSILRTVHQHQPRSVFLTQIESESESEVRSLDRIRTLRPKHLAVRALRIKRNPSESGDDEAQLQIPILRAQYTRISSAQTARTAASTRSNTGSKKEAGQAEDSSRTAT